MPSSLTGCGSWPRGRRQNRRRARSRTQRNVSNRIGTDLGRGARQRPLKVNLVSAFNQFHTTFSPVGAFGVVSSPKGLLAALLALVCPATSVTVIVWTYPGTFGNAAKSVDAISARQTFPAFTGSSKKNRVGLFTVAGTGGAGTLQVKALIG